MSSTKLNALADLRMMVDDDDDEEDDDVQPQVKEEVEVKNECEPLPTVPPTVTTPTKPLKSILKKRKAPESVAEEPVETPKTEQDPPVKKPNFGGSIANALKMIKEVKPPPEEKSNEPQPSAFIQEMEKQKDLLPVPVPGAYGFPYREPAMEVPNMVWGDKNEMPRPQSFFEQEQRRKVRERDRKREAREAVAEKLKVTEMAAKTSLTPLNQSVNCIVLITNLPYTMTRNELVLLLGVWPKDGLDGVHLIAETSGVPAGYAYIVLERHADMMSVVRMTGLEVSGRKIKVTTSNFDALRRDRKLTKRALKLSELSRVVRVAQLPFSLTKSELMDVINCVQFEKEDIYWKPLKENQENSGRGYIVLKSSEEAKKIGRNSYTAGGRVLEVRQVNPEEMKKFCYQCRLHITHELADPFSEEFLKELEKDDYPTPDIQTIPAVSTIKSEKAQMEKSSTVVVLEDLEDASFVHEDEKKDEVKKEESDSSSADDTAKDSPDEADKEKEDKKVVVKEEGKNIKKEKSNDSGKKGDSDSETSHKEKEKTGLSEAEQKRKKILDKQLKKALKEINESRPEGPRGPPRGGMPPPRMRSPAPNQPPSMPPFNLTIHVRMYNVPEKATTTDIRNFFAPILPAKIAENIGYDIYDIEFYNPEDAWASMRKHLLLIRKNVIRLEMLPGPPFPLPPRLPRGPPPPVSEGSRMMGPGPGMSGFPGPMFPRPHVIVPPGTEMGPHAIHPAGLRPMQSPMGAGPMHPDMGPRPFHPGMGPRMTPEMGHMPPGMGPRPMHPMLAVPFPSGMPQGPMAPHGMMPRPLPPGMVPVGVYPPGMEPLPPGMPPHETGPSPHKLGPESTHSRHVVVREKLSLSPPRRDSSPIHSKPPRSLSPRPINPQNMPPPMRHSEEKASSREARRGKEIVNEKEKKDKHSDVKREKIPVPPLPTNYVKYKLPSYNPDTPVGQGVITPMQGYFCQLCNKFYSSRNSAKVAHCKTRGHYDKLKQFLQEKKRLRKLAKSAP